MENRLQEKTVSRWAGRCYCGSPGEKRTAAWSRMVAMHRERRGESLQVFGVSILSTVSGQEH